MAFVVALVLSICSSIALAFVESTLWAWFVVPLGAPAISVAHAWGLSVLAVLPFIPSACTVRTHLRRIDDGHDEVALAIVASIAVAVASGVALGLAAIAKQWI